MATLREFGVRCGKASCAANGYSIGKRDNVAAVHARPRPKGITADPVLGVALF